MTTGTVLKPEPLILETQLRHSDNLPNVSHSTPNTDSSTPTHQVSPLLLCHMKTVGVTEQQNTLELEDQHGLNNCMANTLSSCRTVCDARTENQDNTDYTTWPTNSDRIVSVINDFSKKTELSVCSEHHASTVRGTYTGDLVSMAESDMLALSVDKISDFTETAQLTTAEKGASLERDSGIEALTEGFAEEEGQVAKEALQTNQEAKSAVVTEPVESETQSEEPPSSSKISSKAVESEKKKNGRL